ncbi:MAG: hypothetical protein O6944_08220, partial [Gammaproteobacteria bacterium]|nr:hypothetical protein [Gammaproteobacteria bacterium]
AMALMLVNEALRLNGEASAVATIDAQEAITAVVYHQIQEKTFAAAASKKGKDAADAKHKPIKEVKTFALKLAKERHKQDEKMSAWQISDEILGRVEHRAQELGVKLSPDRSRKTIHGWLKTAGY